MKIIIIGCGKVGSALAEELTMENHEAAIVDVFRLSEYAS